MKTLLILRHAKSSWKNPGLADHERPLNRRGWRDVPRMGGLLRELGLEPDLILSSTAVRARATAEAVAEACGYGGEIELQRDLYHADPEAYVEALRALPDDCACVMVVGHNPGLEELLDLLTDEDEYLPTAALARVDLPVERWSSLNERTRGRLAGLWRPREL